MAVLVLVFGVLVVVTGVRMCVGRVAVAVLVRVGLVRVGLVMGVLGHGLLLTRSVGGLNRESRPFRCGVGTLPADAVERDFPAADTKAGALTDARGDVDENIVVYVINAPAALADKMVMGVLVRRLEERPALAEVGAEHQAVLNQDVQIPVDGGSVDLRQPVAYPRGDLLGAQMRVRLRAQDLPDDGPLRR
jgi:hypothetical protein